MFESQKWIIKNKKPLRIFPNIQNFFLNLSVNINNESSNKQREYKFVSKNQTDVWFFNVKVMREISRIINSNYLVFIQPTMGLEGVQSVFPKENVNDHMLLKETLNNDNYISNLRSTYRGLKEKCKLISFCNDITHIAPPSSESNYSNNRHHNARGNRIIAEEIYKRLKF